MLLFDPLYDAIVETIVASRRITTADLHRSVRLRHPVSIQNFYRIVGRLIADQILIKDGRFLSLHGRWSLGILALADDIRAAELGESSSALDLSPGSTASYWASTLEDLDGIWGDLMLAANRESGPSTEVFVYQSHPYYALGMRETETAFFRAEHSVAPVRFLAGNSGPLDLAGIAEYRRIGIPAYAVDAPPFPSEGYCVTVIGEYVFEVSYPPSVTEYFRFFFDTVDGMEAFDASLFARGFRMRSRCRLSVRRSAKAAESIRNAFRTAVLPETWEPVPA